MKNERKHGRSAHHGNQPSPYNKAGKKPTQYGFQTGAGRTRLANGDLKVKANDKPSNKYQ